MNKTLMTVLLSTLVGHAALAEEPTLQPTSEVAAKTTPVGFAVAPVEVGQLNGLTASGEPVPMTLPNFSNGRHFDPADLPVLPYGSFFVSLANDSDLPISVRPDQLALVAGNKTMHPLVDAGVIEERWLGDAYDDSQYALRGRLVVHDEQRDLHRALKVMTSTVVVAAHGTWSGYVVFDVGRRSAESWTSMVQKARNVQVELQLPSTTLTTTFVAPAANRDRS